MSSFANSFATLALATCLGFQLGRPAGPQGIQQQPGIGGYVHVQNRQSPAETEPAYLRIQPSIVALRDGNMLTGYAALIGHGGYYLAQMLSVPGREIEGRFYTGETTHMRVLGKDGSTQLALLKADNVPPDAKVLSMPSGDLSPGTPLLVVLTGGAVHARIESLNRTGVVRPSNRLLPLNEIRFETPSGSLAGALVFTESGAFVGLLNATLSRQPVFVGGLGGGQAASRGGFARVPAPGSSLDNIPPPYPGPAQLTVAYMPGLDVMRGVVEGFLSPSHAVAYASLGLYCRDGMYGAFVTAVLDGSGASLAGIQQGDLITGVGGYRVRDQIDFAKVMYKQHPGQSIVIRIDRKGRILNLTALVGSSTD